MRRQWKIEEKVAILEEATEGNVIEVCRKHNLSTGTFYTWKKRFEASGKEGLQVKYEPKSKEHKAVEEENRILRKLLSDKDIELEVTREM